MWINGVTMKLKQIVRRVNTFGESKEELASIVYQILYDYDHVEYINMSPMEIEFGVVLIK